MAHFSLSDNDLNNNVMSTPRKLYDRGLFPVFGDVKIRLNASILYILKSLESEHFSQ
jgi:hypothetical protein